MDKRTFIKRFATGGILIAGSGFPLHAFTHDEDLIRLTILHTNDVHSRVDPFPEDGSRNAGLGGAAKRASLIKKIRAEEENVLLFDAGDIFQGTPYFNFFKGEIEMKLMSEMAYDAATIGNHDFDNGLSGFIDQLPHANFPFVNSNYDFSGTALNAKVNDYLIFEKSGIKVGVFGLGIELDGLVPKSLYGNTRYIDPIKKAKIYSTLLKQELKCDYVICLSHLGYKYRDEKISDTKLALNTRNIDLIIGGHTHSFLKQAERLRNIDGKPVLVNQAGWAGIMLGRLDIYFERNRKNKCDTCKNEWVR